MTLPIEEALPRLRKAMAAYPAVVLQAPPGAGKTTLVPLALLEETWLNGKSIVMLEPRRLAARAAAGRMSQLRGENVGETVGYRIRFDSKVSKATRIEVLTPDFRGVGDALDVVLGARPEIFSHNMETVPRLYRQARPGSRYERSLALLADAAARRDRGEYSGRVKTGIMLGLGESEPEVRATLADIRGAGVEVLTIGQYLQPTAEHLPVDRFVPPEEFAELRRHALELGFLHCESGPLVRSSYHAHEHVPPGRDQGIPAAAG